MLSKYCTVECYCDWTNELVLFLGVKYVNNVLMFWTKLLILFLHNLEDKKLLKKK